MNKKDAIIKLAIIIGIIIVINIIAKRVFTRVDLTKNRSYTLSPISKDIVSNLEDKLLVKAYFSNNLPPPYNNLKRQVQAFKQFTAIARRGGQNELRKGLVAQRVIRARGYSKSLR